MMHTNTTALLICRSGELAGSKFELGGDTTIGRDQQNRLVVTPDARAIAERYARVFLDNGTFYLESVGPGGGVSLDGAAVTKATPLDRRHVISLPGDLEFVFSRTTGTPVHSAGVPAAQPAPIPPAAAPPAEPITPPARASAAQTMIDGAGFGSLPSLNKTPTGPIPTQRAEEAPVTAPRAKLAADEKSTMFEAGGFAPLPTLGKKAAAPPPPVVQPPPPPAPPVVPSPPPVVQQPPPPPPRPQTPTAAPTEVFIPPPQDPKLELVATVPDAGTMSFPLKFGDNTIGRAVDCDLCVPDSKNWLSRKHAVLRVSKERVELVDLGGMNGTFMNGAPITTATLSPGSSFSLGPHLEFTLRKT